MAVVCYSYTCELLLSAEELNVPMILMSRLSRQCLTSLPNKTDAEDTALINEKISPSPEILYFQISCLIQCYCHSLLFFALLVHIN